MKKHILIALLPILFQANIYCENVQNNIDEIILPALKTARFVMKSLNTPLILDPILSELKIFAQKNKNAYILAISQIKNINDALQTYKSKQYSSTWSRWFGLTPEIVTKQINPAIQKVKNAHKSILEINNEIFKYYKTDIQTIASETAYLIASQSAHLLVDQALPLYLEKTAQNKAKALQAQQTTTIETNAPTQQMPEFKMPQTHAMPEIPLAQPAQAIPDNVSAAYATLGLDAQTATKADAKAAYRRLVLQYHPDKNPGNPKAEALFKDISIANSIIEDYTA